jgi:hypothetical protein
MVLLFVYCACAMRISAAVLVCTSVVKTFAPLWSNILVDGLSALI